MVSVGKLRLQVGLLALLWLYGAGTWHFRNMWAWFDWLRACRWCSSVPCSCRIWCVLGTCCLGFIGVLVGHFLLHIYFMYYLLSCLYFLLLASLPLKNMLYNIDKQFKRGMVKIFFGLIGAQVGFLIN